MIAKIRLTIDLKAVVGKFLFIFPRYQYAKATFEGEMEVGDIRSDEILSLQVFNQIPSDFVVRQIQRIPRLKPYKDIENLIELYARSRSGTITDKGIRYHSIRECVERLNTSIATNLYSNYGISILEESCKVGPEPTYTYLPSSVGARSFEIISMTH
jgi:hypothetical protein